MWSLTVLPFTSNKLALSISSFRLALSHLVRPEWNEWPFYIVFDPKKFGEISVGPRKLSHPHGHNWAMTSKRSTSRTSGRFTSPGTSRPGSTASKRSECPCVACLAEESGVPFDRAASWERMQRIIETRGYCIQYVMAPPNGVSWAYTIGRLRAGLPELVVVGLDSVGSAVILNSIASEWDRIVIPEDGASHIQAILRTSSAP